MKNWRSFVFILFLGIASIGFSGCSKMGPAASNDDIRKAIETHLASKPGLSASEIVLEVKKVDVKGDSAEADVIFRSKSNPNASMDFHYRLHNEGGAWKVEAPAASSAHAGANMPPQGGASDAAPQGGTGMPGATGMPEGHPKIN